MHTHVQNKQDSFHSMGTIRPDTDSDTTNDSAEIDCSMLDDTTKLQLTERVPSSSADGQWWAVHTNVPICRGAINST